MGSSCATICPPLFGLPISAKPQYEACACSPGAGCSRAFTRWGHNYAQQLPECTTGLSAGRYLRR